MSWKRVSEECFDKNVLYKSSLTISLQPASDAHLVVCGGRERFGICGGVKGSGTFSSMWQARYLGTCTVLWNFGFRHVGPKPSYVTLRKTTFTLWIAMCLCVRILFVVWEHWFAWPCVSGRVSVRRVVFWYLAPYLPCTLCMLDPSRCRQTLIFLKFSLLLTCHVGICHVGSLDFNERVPHSLLHSLLHLISSSTPLRLR